VSKVIQIRGVPDDVHAAITRAADERGVSLTSYIKAELAHLAERPAIVRHNAEVVRRTKQRVRGNVDRSAIQSALAEVRGEE
jgi:hypothetical protein